MSAGGKHAAYRVVATPKVVEKAMQQALLPNCTMTWKRLLWGRAAVLKGLREALGSAASALGLEQWTADITPLAAVRMLLQTETRFQFRGRSTGNCDGGWGDLIKIGMMAVSAMALALFREREA